MRAKITKTIDENLLDKTIDDTEIPTSIKEFQTKYKEISNRFNINDNMASCFICNYGEDSDICRDCSAKSKCLKIAKQMNNKE